MDERKGDGGAEDGGWEEKGYGGVGMRSMADYPSCPRVIWIISNMLIELWGIVGWEMQDTES